MRFSSNNSQDDPTSGVDLTSMIDVLFVLLLFFMVTTTFSNSSDILVNLPASKSGKPSQIEAKSFIIYLTEDKKIFLIDEKANKNEFNLDSLGLRIKEEKEKNPAVDFIIKADKKVEHGSVVTLLDDLKNAGVENVGIATDTSSN